MNERSPTLAAEDPTTRRAGWIMMVLFAIANLLFVCGGAIFVGAAASGSERDGVNASYLALGPATFAIVGLLVSIISHFAIKKSAALKVIIPLVAALIAAPCAVAALAIFYETIWPSL